MSKNINVNKKIIIYPHTRSSEVDGGNVVQYYFAYILDTMFNQEVFICNKCDNNASNHIFNKFIDINSIPEEEQENTVVIYCEGIMGNPLKAKHVVRWMLSKLGQNVQMENYFTWRATELVYFFNSEKNIIDNEDNVKYLTVLYINPEINNLNSNRNGCCFTKRKCIHSSNDIHPPNSFEVHRNHDQKEYIDFFNKYEMFFSYDPLSFLSIIAIICGCISVVVPIKGVTKKDYFKMTSLYSYMIDKNIDSIYGLAYGNSHDELNFAKNTIYLGREQILDIQKWFINKYVNSFIKDINNWNNNSNVLHNYKNMMLFNKATNSIDEINNNIDFEFYRTTNVDLSTFDTYQLFSHYMNWGKKEGRLISDRQAKHLTSNQDFDIKFYKSHHQDLKNFSSKQLVEHYINYGRKEGRLVSESCKKTI